METTTVSVLNTGSGIEKEVFAFMDATMKDTMPEKPAQNVFQALEAKQHGPISPYQFKFANLAIVKWLKKNDTRPKPGLVIIGSPLPVPKISKKFTFKLSPELAAVLGEEVLSGLQIRLRLLKIIDEEGLCNPDDLSEVITSEKLMPIFRVPKFKLDYMMSYLVEDHMTSLEECERLNI